MEPILYFFIISEHLPKPHQISEGLGFEPLELEITFPKMAIFGPSVQKGREGAGGGWGAKTQNFPWDTKYKIGVPDLLSPKSSHD